MITYQKLLKERRKGGTKGAKTKSNDTLPQTSR